MTQSIIANTLTAIPTVGQVVRYLGAEFRWLTPGKEYTIEEIDEDGDAVFYDNDGDEMWIVEGNLSNYQLVDTAPLTELPQVGQVVIYVGPSRDYLTVGKAYEIIDIDEDSDAVFIDDDGDEAYVFEDELDDWEVVVEDAPKSVAPKPSEANPLGLALGDKVRILDASGIMGGSVSFKDGDITEVIGFLSGHVQLKPTLDDHDHLTLFGKECAFIEKYVPEVVAKEVAEVVAEEVKFNVGDLVKILDVDAIEYGEEHFEDGDIVEVAHTTFDGERPFLTGTKQDDTLYIMGSELHAIKLLPFKVGDKVTLKDTRGAMGGFEVGGTYPIIAINHGGWHDFELITPSGIHGFANESSLELAEEKQNETGDEEMAKVQTGDKVRLTDTNGALIGFSVGELCEVVATRAIGFFQIELVSLDRPGRIGYADESSLEIVAQPLTKMPKKGDVVRASRVGASRFVKEGKEYTILGVDEAGHAFYEGEDGVSDVDGANRIKEWFMDEFDLVSEAAEVVEVEAVEAVATAPTCSIANELEARVDAMEKRLNALETGNVDIVGTKVEQTEKGITMSAGGFRIISDSITLGGGTPNERRKAIVEKAKQFVATIQSEVSEYHEDKYDANSLYNDFVTESYFEVDAKKGTVEVIVVGARIPVEYGRAIAKCNPEDVFNEYIGQAIAIGRVYGLDVSEFEMAVQPELAVGQEVETLYFSGGVNHYCPTTVTRLKNYGSGKVPGFSNGSHSSKFRITEDTNAQY